MAGEQDPIWDTWRAVTRVMAMRGMVLETFFGPSVWRMFGVDFLTGLRLNRSSRRLIDILAPLSAHDLRRIHALAQINHRRHEAISRWYALGMLTVPVSAALALAQTAPDAWAAVRKTHETGGWLVMIVYLAAVVAFYLLAAWRARQLATVIEIAMVERGVLPESPVELELPAEPPIRT